MDDGLFRIVRGVKQNKVEQIKEGDSIMNLQEVMHKLEEMGSQQTKRTFIRHGAKEPFFGVKIGDLKTLVKHVKKDQQLARALYDTGNSDAMYLAGLSVDPKTMSKELLQHWAKKACWYMIAEYTVAGAAAESDHGLELAREWIRSEDEMTATCGWSTFANYISITPDEQLDLDEIRLMLDRIERTIHIEKNRVRYTMNAFVIAVGAHVMPLYKEAMKAAEQIGKVHVDVGSTACKVPLATEYIKKIESKGNLGTKRKTCIC